ncbi:MAG TPA: GntR family transcriptional regulator [Candidatus Mediterraneibacter colneyensis]|nr:GntR family transcriptional regulator [Candidatus Mediterraneibacter colneyensis]
MILQVDMSSEIPIYIQLRNEIVKGIGRGELSAGENLPTVRQLASDLGVNTMTVSKAYQLLKSEGFIETDRRKGAVVKPCMFAGKSTPDVYRERLGDELELLSAEAKLRGMNREEFISLCEGAFAAMEV